MPTLFRALTVLASAVCAMGAAFVAQAQEYPTSLVRIVVGPGPDIVARLLLPKMTEALGQQVIVEPRAGAGGVIAARTVASAAPDGHMVLMSTASYTIGTALGTMPHDLRTEYEPIALAAIAPFVLIVHPSVKANNVAELIALAKDNPGKLNYASSGIGTPPHLAGELFKALAGIDIVHVPFREANSALQAIMAGEVEMMFSIASVAQSQIAGGAVRGLGVTTSEPSALVPDMPTVAQAAPGFEVAGWNGFVVPKDTPSAVAAKLNAAVLHGLEAPEVREQLRAAGYEPAQPNTPEQFADFIRNDTRKWIDLAASAGIKSK